MTKRGFVRLMAILIAVAMPMLTVLSVSAETEAEAFSTEVKYTSPDVNELSGLGEEPEDLSVSAGAEYLEKAWYEYVVYSQHAVASYRLNDEMRLLFYDPFTYTNSMVMEVNFDATTTEFDTMSSYSISKTNTRSVAAAVTSTDTSTEAVQTSGRDHTYTNVQNGGSTKTIYNHSIEDETSGVVKEYTDYEYRLYTTTDSSTTNGQSTSLVTTLTNEATGKIGTETGFEDTFSTSAANGWETGSETTYSTNHAWLTNRETNTTEYGDGYKTTTKYTGDDTVEYNTNSVTTGWTELAARVTKTTGSSRSTSYSWTEEESTTVTKTYAATHFASDGVTPLPWAIVHYEVTMPVKCVMQIKDEGEWISVSTVYCMLTTVKGTCRAWMQNGQVYYEDWGSGEPVVATDFWRQFTTKESLIKAYNAATDEDKEPLMYPVGGAD